MKKTLSLLVVIFLGSCQNLTVEERFNKISDSDKKDLIEELEQMVDKDQFLRKKSISLNKSSPSYDRINDSLWDIIDSLDLANTERLIEITEKYGFPNVDRIDAPIPAWLIFQHAPEENFEELKVLLKKENESERLPDLEYSMITWHLNGRKTSNPLGDIITKED
ncbi:hypothetical protein LB465_17815 [Salegentibacter sp. LM13S]|uniref:hypothetical protein n=1 Tax=Salegentibacter lacus TaxID=2873599 RepID=UPI001CC9D60C|nr:hypothetical protein [Salegentibacter lacus]MBZ9632639.1 hypothetical protein [Salegentibacter lacus]